MKGPSHPAHTIMDRLCNGCLPLGILISVLTQMAVTLYMFPGVVRMVEIDADVISTYGGHMTAAKEMTTQCKTFTTEYEKIRLDSDKTNEKDALKQTYKDALRVWSESLEKYSETVTFYGGDIPNVYKGKSFGPVDTWDINVPTNLTAGAIAKDEIATKYKAFVDKFFTGLTIVEVVQTDSHLYTLTLHGQSGTDKVRVKPSTVDDIEIRLVEDKEGDNATQWKNFRENKVPTLKADLCDQFTKMAQFNERLVYLTMNRVTAYIAMFMLQFLVALAFNAIFFVSSVHERLDAFAPFRPALSFFGLLFSFISYNIFLNADAKIESTSVHELISPVKLFGDKDTYWDGEAEYYLVLAWLGVFVFTSLVKRVDPSKIFGTEWPGTGVAASMKPSASREMKADDQV